MRNNSVNLHVRLNLNRPDQKKAWEYIQKAQKDPSVAINQMLSKALVESIERDRRCEVSVLPEDCLVVQQSIRQIITAIQNEIAKTIPAYLAGVLSTVSWNVSAQATCVNPVVSTAAKNEDGINGRPIPPEEIDWSFLGE